MRNFRSVALICGAVLVVLAISTWVEQQAALPLAAAPADFLDVPESLAANAAGDVYVSFWTDTLESPVRRFSPDGTVLAQWTVAPPAGHQDAGVPYVTEAPDGGVYVALPGGDAWVRRYMKDGASKSEWGTGDLLPAITTGPPGSSTDVPVFTLNEAIPRVKGVVRWTSAGQIFSEWLVHITAYDIAGGAHADIPEGLVYVADKDFNKPVSVQPGHLTRYRTDGTRVDAWDLSGEVAGLDVSGDGTAWVAQLAVETNPPFFQSFDQEGTPGLRCELPPGTTPVDLTVSPDTSVYLIVHRASDRDHPFAVLRFLPDCTLSSTWELETLNGLRPPATVVIPTPTDTGVPSATASPTTGGTASATPSPTVGPVASTTPSASPSPATAIPSPAATPTLTKATSLPYNLELPALLRSVERPPTPVGR